jgi:ABC-type Fe3+-hydroxamate transport system substrate-binding protein
MEQKTLIAIVAVVVVAAVAIGAFVLMNQGGSDDEPTYDIPDTRMLVFGNANNDDYLDSSDLTFLKAIVNGSATWDKKTNLFADTNTDGTVDQKDVDLLSNILAGKKTTMYYLNWHGNVRSINYPLSGNIAGSYVDIAALAWIAGCYDDITSIRQTQQNLDNLDPVQFPGAAGKWKTVSDDTNTTFDVQKLLAQKVKVVLTDPDFIEGNGLLEKMHEADKSMNVIELPINRAVGDVDWTHTIITLGAMYQNQDKTKEYVEFVEKVEKKIKDKMDYVKQKYPDQTFLICYEPTSALVTDLDIFGKTDVQYGDVANMVRLPLTCALDPMADTGYIEGYKIEDVITLNPTVICIESWGKINTMSEDEYYEVIQKWVSYFSKTGAYANDKVVTFAYEVYGTVPGIAGMIYMGSLIWPDAFDAEEGIEYLNEYYQKFTPMGEDFDVTEHYGFLPVVWGSNIN